MPGRRRARAAFLGAFALVWTAFGLVAFLGDVVLHHVVDATPWLAERPWLIEAAILALAGRLPVRPDEAAQPRGLPASGGTGRDGRHGLAGTRAASGSRHGLACLGSSWALMLLMFAEGFASLGWMAALTALMVYEASGRHGQRAARSLAIALILAAVAVLSGVSGPSA